MGRHVAAGHVGKRRQLGVIVKDGHPARDGEEEDKETRQGQPLRASQAQQAAQAPTPPGRGRPSPCSQYTNPAPSASTSNADSQAAAGTGKTRTRKLASPTCTTSPVANPTRPSSRGCRRNAAWAIHTPPDPQTNVQTASCRRPMPIHGALCRADGNRLALQGGLYGRVRQGWQEGAGAGVGQPHRSGRRPGGA